MRHAWVKIPGDVWHQCIKCQRILSKENEKGDCDGWPEPPLTIRINNVTYWRNDLVDIKPAHAEFITKQWEMLS